MKAEHLKRLINETLKLLPVKYQAESAVDLLMLTAAQESHLGEYLYQLGDGPALGIFQIEPATYQDLYTNYLSYRHSERELLWLFKSKVPYAMDLAGNLMYQIAVARLQYYRQPGKLPTRAAYPDEYDYITKLAEYWKFWWNTVKGKGTVTGAVNSYNLHVRRST